MYVRIWLAKLWTYTYNICTVRGEVQKFENFMYSYKMFRNYVFSVIIKKLFYAIYLSKSKNIHLNFEGFCVLQASRGNIDPPPRPAPASCISHIDPHSAWPGKTLCMPVRSTYIDETQTWEKWRLFRISSFSQFFPIHRILFLSAPNRHANCHDLFQTGALWESAYEFLDRKSQFTCMPIRNI